MKAPSKRSIQAWVKALRGGKYKQTVGTLQDENGFCCLGVACQISKKKMLRQNSYLFGGLASAQESSPKWLRDVNDHFESLTGSALSILNDADELTFDEIADCLEAVYIHKVLEQQNV